MLTVATVVAPVSLFMVGAGMASPFALAGSVSVNPQMIGAASGLYGFIQMGYGMLCTVVVETWHPGAIYPVAAVLLGSALLGQTAMADATASRAALNQRQAIPPVHTTVWNKRPQPIILVVSTPASRRLFHTAVAIVS